MYTADEKRYDTMKYNRCGKSVISFSPLAQGMLTDRYLNGIPDDSRIMTDGRFLNREQLDARLDQIRRLNDLAADHRESESDAGCRFYTGRISLNRRDLNVKPTDAK